MTINFYFKSLYLMAICGFLFFAQPVTSTAASVSVLSEDKIKAGLIFNFINFTRWPETAFSDSGSDYTICIVDKKDYPEIFNIITTQSIHERKVRIQKIEPAFKVETIKICHVLVILLKNKKDKNESLATVSQLPILTIAESDDNKDASAMINLIKDDDMIGFTINRSQAKQSGIEFSSKMLRLAINVVGGN